jgi:hypothetical protein
MFDIVLPAVIDLEHENIVAFIIGNMLACFESALRIFSHTVLVLLSAAAN